MAEQKPIKAAAYLRVSTEDQREGFSLDFQLDAIRNYCKLNNYELVREVKDVLSGSDTERPELQRLLAEANAGVFNAIVVYKYDRFSRDQIDLLVLARDLKKVGVILKSVNEGFDVSMPMGNILMGLAGGLAQHERETILKRSRDGMMKRAASGKFSGGQVPYGYRYDPQSGTLQILEQEAKWVRRMFDWSVKDGMSEVKIVERLNAEGVPTKNGKSYWQRGVIHKLLKNPVYSGQFCYNKNKEAKNRTKTANPKEQWVKAEVPAIVSKEIFQQAQTASQKRKVYSSRNTKHEYLLQGLLHCSECGRRLFGVTTYPSRYVDKRTGRKRSGSICQYYKCPGRDKTHIGAGQEKCLTPHVMSAAIENAVWEQVREVLRNPGKILESAIRQDKELQSQKENLTGRIAEINEAMQRIKNQESRLLEVYTRGTIDLPEFEKKRAELSREKGALVLERNRLTGSLTAKDEEKGRIQAISERLAGIVGKLEKMNFAGRRQVLRDMLTRIEIDKDRRITLYGVLQLPGPTDGKDMNIYCASGVQARQAQFVRRGIVGRP